jgi:hypothetical protein
MDRSRGRGGWYWVALSLLLAASVIPSGGCVGALTTVAYLIKGTDQPAEFAGLKGKTVAVVCRPVTSLQYSNSNAAADVARHVGLLLGKNVSKIRVIDPQKVAEWTDENTTDDFVEIGRALKADMVVAIDLEHFNLLQSQVLYQGKANVAIRVYDIKQDGKVVYQKAPPQTIFPPNVSIPTSDKSQADFQRQFVGVLAEEIGRHFYPHDPSVDFAKDTSVLD